MCKGCTSRHWIADNLGWSKHVGGFDGEETNIEEYFANRGDDDAVNRVSQDVFELERVLNVESGAILDENGNPMLE